MRTARTNSRAGQGGYTLVEMVIAVALFTAVMVIAASAYLSLIALNRHSRATSDIVANLSFAVESMARSIRTGNNYSCAGGTNCWPNGGSSFSFTNDQGQKVFYLLKSNGQIGECLGASTCSDSASTPLTDPRVTVTDMTFFTQGVGASDTLQPTTIISVTGSIVPNPGVAPIPFTIQTGATQRLLDL